jgi:hypothetical protein
MTQLPIQPTAYRVTSTAVTGVIISNAGRVEMAYLLRNTHATVSVFFGDSAVTTATGYELRAGEAMALGLSVFQTLYGVSPSDVVIDVIERVSQ